MTSLTAQPVPGPTAHSDLVGEGPADDPGRLEAYLRERVSRQRNRAAPTGPEPLPLPVVARLGRRDAFAATPGPLSPDHYPVHLADRSLLFGPVTPASDAGDVAGPCAHCLALRRQKVRTEPERLAIERGAPFLAPREPQLLTPFTLEAAWQLYRQVAGAKLDAPHARVPGPGSPAGRPVSGLGYVHELALDTLRVRRYPLIADADCVVCGLPEPDDAEAARPLLVSRPKPGTERFRLQSVGDFDLPVDGFANPVCGVLGSAAHADLGCATTAPVNGRYRTRIADHLLEVAWGGHADNYADSEVLGVFEGLERQAGGSRRRRHNTVVDSFHNLRPHALDPRDCGLYTPSLYRRQDLLVEFDPDVPIPWVWGWSLRDERPVLVPERMAYYMGRAGGADNFVHECSNGCAGGGSYEEALLHGMLELAERDAFLLAWYGRAELPEIDPLTCTSPSTRAMLDRIRLLGYDARLFDTRIDLPFPVVTAVAERRDGGMGRLCFAAGAGLDPEDAVRGALCEIASYIASLPERVRKRGAELSQMVGDFEKVTQLEDHATLFGLPEMAHHADFLLRERPPEEVRDMRQQFADWQARRPVHHDLLDDVRYCRQAFADAGFDVLAIDQTSPEQRAVGLHTVRVVVPGLVPIDFGWQKQRALTLPRTRSAFRRAGWRTTDLGPEELNRVPHPFP